jgi:SAM-dependent methyltransferase
MTWYREWFGEDYLELYSYRDAQEAKDHAAFFHQRVGRVNGAVLDLACGMGRHLAEFEALGYRAVGCDLSYILLRTGAGRYGRMPLVRADMRQLPFRDGAFGGLVNFFTSFGYFDSPQEDAQTLREMARVLGRGSTFLFDYLNVSRELSRLVEREEKVVDGERVVIERWFDNSSRTFNKRITIGERRFLERVRGYDVDEITSLFTTAGFSIRDVFGGFDGSVFDSRSARLILTGTKQT